MQSMQRQIGRFMKRSADDSQVSVLLKDFDEADKLLTKIIDSTKAWRDAWSSLLTYQSRMVNEFEGLYAPILGSSDPTSGQKAVVTPEATLARTNRLKEEYEDLKKELLQELNAVDERMIKPAVQAKDYLSPMKKTIKKRDDRKLDFERYQSRFDNYSKKSKRSDRDNAALVKAESELAKATEEYHAADENLRQYLPQLIAAAFSILPHLLAAQIEIQNSMLAHYYTVLHNYCEQEQFPSPPPPMETVIQEWERDFLPAQQEAEALGCLANGKAIRQAMSPEEPRNGTPVNGRPTNGTGSYRRSSSSHAPASRPPASPGRGLPPPTPVYETKPRLSPLPSPAASATLNVPGSQISPQASLASSVESYSTVPEPAPVAFSPAAPRTDYFSRDRQPSATSTSTSTSTSPGFHTTMAFAKKKPPPPPPPRSASAHQALFVTALYDFGGQGAGDLAFREGDRIRVVKKTNSTDDWWEGELRGVKGSFPANYVR